MPIELRDIRSGYNLAEINNNFKTIERTWDEKLDRLDSLQGNQMSVDLDMNSKAILNVKTSSDKNSLVNKEYVDSANEIQDERLGVLEESFDVGSGTSSVSWTYIAVGGETSVSPPFHFNNVRELHVNGLLKTEHLDWSWTESQGQQINIATALSASDVVVVRVGGESTDLIPPDVTLEEIYGVPVFELRVGMIISPVNNQYPKLKAFNAIYELQDNSVTYTVKSFAQSGIDDCVITLSDDSSVIARKFKVANNSVIATGATTARKLADRFAETVNVLDWGVKNDGSDSTNEIANCIVKNQGKVLTFPAGEYAFDDTDFTGVLGIEGVSSSQVKFRCLSLSGTFITSGTDTWQTVQGVTTTAIDDYGMQEFTISNPTGLSSNDQLCLYDPTNSSWSGFREYYRKGEFLTVDSVNGNTVKVRESIKDVYRLGITVYKRINRPFTVRGINLISPVLPNMGFGISISGATGVTISDVISNTWGYTTINIDACRYITVNKAILNMCELVASGTNYCLAFNCSQDARVSEFTGYSVRHPITLGGSGTEGRPICRNIHISNSYLVGTGVFGAADFHGNVEGCSYRDCTIEGGVVIGGQNNSVIDNNIYGNSAASAIYASGLRSLTHQVTGNKIYAFTSAASRGAALDISGNSNALSDLTTQAGEFTFDCNDIYTDSISGTPLMDMIRIFNRGCTATIGFNIRSNFIHTALGAESIYFIDMGVVSGSQFDVNFSLNTLVSTLTRIEGAKDVVALSNSINAKYISVRESLRVSNSGVATVNNNTIINSSSSAISIANSNLVVCNSNTVSEFGNGGTTIPTQSGIIISNCADVSVSSNTVRGTSPNSLWPIVVVDSNKMFEGVNCMYSVNGHVNSPRYTNIGNSSQLIRGHVSTRLAGSSPQGVETVYYLGEQFIQTYPKYSVWVGKTVGTTDWINIFTEV